MLIFLSNKLPENIFLLLSACVCIYSCTDKKHCKENFDFTAEEYNSIPYLKDKIIIFQNIAGQKDTFIITNVKNSLSDFRDPIETGDHHYREIEIRYTNKKFQETTTGDIFLFNIKKECVDEKISYYGEWMDFAGFISFNRDPERCNLESKIDSLKIKKQVINNITRYDTDTIKCPETKDRDIQTVYWQSGKGVVMYTSKKSGTWKRIN